MFMAGSEVPTWKCRRCRRFSYFALTSMSGPGAALRVRAATNRLHGANSLHSVGALNERQPSLGSFDATLVAWDKAWRRKSAALSS